MAKLFFLGKVCPAGKLTVTNLRLMNAEIKEHLKGKRVCITIETEPEKTTQRQAAFWFAHVVPTVQNGLRGVGHIMTPEAVNKYLCNEFLGNGNVIGESGCVLPLPFCDLLTQVRIWAGENLHVVINDPGQR